MRTIADFHGIHAGQTAWLFGKGASLDAFLRARRRPEVCPVLALVNDLVAYEPAIREKFSKPDIARHSPAYCFANDSVRRFAVYYRPHDILFVPRRTLLDRTMDAPPPAELACETIVFDDGDPYRIRLPAARLVTEGLAARHGTISSAAQILHIMGITALVCVGIDGDGSRTGLAGLLPARPDVSDDGAREYALIRADFESACAHLGLPVTFHGEPPPKLNDSNSNLMKIRIISSVLLSGQHCEAGHIVDVSKDDAALAIAQCQAEKADPAAKLGPIAPPPAKKETAAKKTPEKEGATAES